MTFPDGMSFLIFYYCEIIARLHGFSPEGTIQKAIILRYCRNQIVQSNQWNLLRICFITVYI